MNEPLNPIGERLKAAREAKGLSAQKVADALHLDPWVIEALETGDYARIGPSVYIKGYLKRYAELTGLPAVDMLDAYASRPSAPAPAAAVELPATPVQPLRPESRRVSLVGLAATALILVGVYWWTAWKPRTAGLPSTSQVEAAASSAAPAADEGVPPAAASAEDSGAFRTGDAGAAAALSARAAANTGPGADAVAGAGLARLRLSFSADSWVDIHDATGRRLYAGNGRANSVKTIAGNAPMKVYLGFASGVQLEVNNHAVAIGPQFVAGDVARFEAGADGVLRRDSRTATAGNSHPRG